MQNLDPKGAYTMQEELQDQINHYFFGKAKDNKLKSAFPCVEKNELIALSTILDARFKNRVK